MVMQVTVLMGSPRKNGNTSLLVQNFIEGLPVNANCEVINVASLHINACVGCNACFSTEMYKCSQKDDMDYVYRRLKETDVLIIASPVYFYGLSAQLKSLIDRLHNPIRGTFRISKLGLMLVGAATIPNLFDPILLQYKMCLDYFNLVSVGEVLVPGVKDVGEIVSHIGLADAKRMAAKLTHS